MPEIPAEAVRAASAAIERVMREAAHPLSYEEMGEAAAKAAAPFLAEHIAGLITLNVRNPDHSKQDRGKWFTVPTSMAYVDGHDNAARITCEAFPLPSGTIQDAPESGPGISGRSDDPKAVASLSGAREEILRKHLDIVVRTRAASRDGSKLTSEALTDFVDQLIELIDMSEKGELV